jgi:hypothetical protein
MEKVNIPSLNDSAKYITEVINKSKKGYNITYQKRIIEAKPSE